MKFICRIENKKIQNIIERPNGDYICEITKIKDVRSLKANNFYWGYVLPPIAEWCGHSPEELHEFFKVLFNLQTTTIGDITKEFGGTTTVMSTQEFQTYINKIIAWANEQGCQIEFQN